MLFISTPDTYWVKDHDDWCAQSFGTCLAPGQCYNPQCADGLIYSRESYLLSASLSLHHHWPPITHYKRSLTADNPVIVCNVGASMYLLCWSTWCLYVSLLSQYNSIRQWANSLQYDLHTPWNSVCIVKWTQLLHAKWYCQQNSVIRNSIWKWFKTFRAKQIGHRFADYIF